MRAIVEGEVRKAGTRAVLFAAAFDILREVVRYVTPGSPIDFEEQDWRSAFLDCGKSEAKALRRSCPALPKNEGWQIRRTC